MMKSTFLLVFALAIPAVPDAPAADTAALGAPVMGYTFDTAGKALRPVSGFPGAATIGSPLDLGMAASWSGASPRQDYAVTVSVEDGAVRLVALQAGFAARSLALAYPSPALVAFSPTGSSLALYRRDRPALQIFTQLPLHPVLSHEIDLGGLDSLLSAAISDDGELALLLAGDPESSTVWLSRSGSSPAPLDTPFASAALAFQNGRDRAALATRDGSFYLLENLSTGQDVRSLSPADDRLADPVAVRFSADGASVFIATRTGTAAAFDTTSAQAVFASCGCRPTSLAPLNSRMLRLNEISDGPLMLVDTADPQLRIWFVPALVPAVSPEGSAQ